MEIKAELNFLRMSPRKVRLAADMIRGKKVADALNIVKFSGRWASKPLLKLLNSAIANATHNFNLQKDDLYIKTIKVNQGPMLKRFSARAFGRAAEIQKKTSHIIIVLAELAKPAVPKKEVVAEKAAETGKLKVKNEKLKIKERRPAAAKVKNKK